MAASDREPRLTRREEQCLRLVADGFLSDEIARELKLSTHTVNRYVEEAMRKLGQAGRGRRAVARDFVRAHPSAAPEQLVPEPVGLEAGPSDAVEPSRPDGGNDGEADRGAEQAPRRGGLFRRLPIRRRGERFVDLTALETLIWVPLLALLMLVLLGVALTNLETANRLRREGSFDGLFPHHPAR